jgi:hypothetical protein
MSDAVLIEVSFHTSISIGYLYSHRFLKAATIGGRGPRVLLTIMLLQDATKFVESPNLQLTTLLALAPPPVVPFRF